MKVPVGNHVVPLIEYSYVPYPPAASVKVIVPSSTPLHVISVLDTVALNGAAGSVIVTLAVAIQLFASVTVTVYTPANKPVVSILCPPCGHV